MRLRMVSGLPIVAAAVVLGLGGTPGFGEDVLLTPATAEQVLAEIRSSGSAASLVNVWATWCLPCREEFPALLELYHHYRDRDFRLVLISADFDDQIDSVKQYLDAHDVDFETYLKVGPDMPFIDALSPSWTGALPATFIYDAQGRLRDFWQGKASYETMEERLLRVLREPAQESNAEEPR